MAQPLKVQAEEGSYFYGVRVAQPAVKDAVPRSIVYGTCGNHRGPADGRTSEDFILWDLESGHTLPVLWGPPGLDLC